MDVRQKAAKGIFWSIVEGWGSQVISLLVFFLLARLLSPEDFGLVAIANICLSFIKVFLNQGFSQALIQRREIEPEHLDTAFWTDISLGLVLIFSILFGSDIFASWFQEPQISLILKYLTCLIFLTSLSNVQKALLEREFQFKQLARRSFLGLFCGGVVGVTMAGLGYGVWSLVGQQVTNEFVSTIVLWKASHWRPTLRFSNKHFKQLFKFGSSLFALNFIGFFNRRGSSLMIGYFLGAGPLGYYTVANRVIDIILQLLVSKSSQVFLPTFSRLQDDLVEFRNVFYNATQLVSLLAFPAFLGLFTLAPEIIPLFFGDQWQEAIPILQVLVFAGMVQAISFFKGHILVAMGKPSWRLWQSLLSITINLIGFAIALRWGIIAVAIAHTVRRYLVFPVGQWAIQLLIKISWSTYLRQFILPIAASAAMVMVMFLVKRVIAPLTTANLLIVLTCSTAGIITYAAIVFIHPPKPLVQLLKMIQGKVKAKLGQ